MDKKPQIYLSLILLNNINYAKKIKAKKKKKTRQRSCWMKNWLRERESYSAYNMIFRELQLQDTEHFRKYLRMNTETYELLLSKIQHQLEKNITKMRKPISAQEKIAITLRFLATGESYKSLMYQYRISESTISLFVPRVCEVIIDTLLDEYMPFPDCEDKWLDIANNFEERWEFPNCCGAIDGKHIALFHPFNSGSTYYNYKGFYSIVLMALVDADYKFIYVDIGCQGRLSDGGVFRNSELYEYFVAGNNKIPPDRPLPDLSSMNDSFLMDPERDVMVPYVIVADDAFPLLKNVMKPYPQQRLSDSKRIFNYRLSRARRTTENAFGILSNRFRVLSGRMYVKEDTAERVTMCCCLLHNFLRSNSRNSYAPSGYTDEIMEDGNIVAGHWRQNQCTPFMEALPASNSRHACSGAEEVRDVFKEYFFGRGQIPWQWKHIY